jgi:hypothetical protein
MANTRRHRDATHDTMAAVDVSHFNSTNSSLANHLLLAVPRFAIRAGAFAIHYLPEQLDGFLGKLLTSKRSIAPPTLLALDVLVNSTGSSGATSLRPSATMTKAPTSATTSAAALGAAPESLLSLSFMPSLASIRKLASFGHYVASKWAFATFLIVGSLSFQPG